MSKINRESVLSYFLGFVVLWFGFNEVFYTSKWVGMVPKFLGSGDTATYLVILHGIVLIVAGLMLVFNYKRRTGAIIIALLMVQIILGFLGGGGLSAVAVRDIGLFGMALALSMRG